MNYGNISDNNLHPCHFAFPPPALKRQSRGKASRIHPEKTARRQLQSHQRPPPVKQRLQHADRPYYYIHLWNLRHRDQVLSRLDLRRRKQRILDTEHLRQQIPTPQSDSSKQGHIRALKFLLKDSGNIPFILIVAFSRQASLGIDAHSPVIYWDQILLIINQFETRVLSESQIQSIYNILLTNNTEDKDAKKQHISNVRHNELKRDIAIANGYCPQCGGTLTLRQGKYGKFYGCSNYPRCKYTTPYR